MSDNKLDRQVTVAIENAEYALDQAIRAWEAVEEAEVMIADFPGSTSNEKGIAERGVGYARMKVTMLKALRNG